MEKLLADHLTSDDMLREVRSALPDAPVVSDGREPRAARPRAVRTRTVLAHGLERLASAIAPSAPGSCEPAH